MHAHRLKLHRALEHLNLIQAHADSWVERDPCKVVGEAEGDGRYVWRVRIAEAAPSDQISILIGDFLHNLRQSIDYLAYTLAVSLSGNDPPPNEAATAFPIASDATEFKNLVYSQVAAKRRLPPPVFTALEGLQRYKRPGGQWLHILKAMHDLDKHRKPTVVAGGVVSLTTDLNRLQASGSFTVPGNGLREDGAPVLELEGAPSNMDVDFDITPGIAFGPSTPFMAGKDILGALRPMRRWVAAEVFPAVEPFL